MRSDLSGVAAVAGAIVALAFAGAAAAAPAYLAPTDVDSTANAPAALTDAWARLAMVPLSLPPGAMRSQTEPSSIGTGPGIYGSLYAADNAITVGDWWVVPESMSRVVSYIEAHGPRGAGKPAVVQTTGGPNGVTFENVAADWRTTSAVGGRGIEFGVSPLGGGSSAVGVSSDSVWLTRRPAGEQFPTAARLMTISSLWALDANCKVTHYAKHMTFTKSQKIVKILAGLNSLRAIQPIPPCISCGPGMGCAPGLPPVRGVQRITVSFYVRRRVPPISAVTIDGGAVDVRIRGKTWPALSAQTQFGPQPVVFNEIYALVGARL